MVSQSYQSIDQVTSGRSQATQSTRIAVAPHRPWKELVDRGVFGKPESFADSRYRMKRNVKYFRANYAIFMLVVIGFSLLWHPLSLIALAILVAAWMYLYFCRSAPLTIFGRTLGDNLVLGFLSIVTIVVLFLTGGGAALLTGLVIGIVVIAVHGAFRSTNDLFLDEQENAASGTSNLPTSSRTVQS